MPDGVWSYSTWKVDLETGERNLFYRDTSEAAFRSSSIDRNRQVMFAIEVPPDKISSEYLGIFDLIQIDLVTGKRTLLWQKENLIAITAFPPNSDYLLLTYFPHVEKYFGGLQAKTCLFSLIDHTCTELEQKAAANLGNDNTMYWVNEKTFLRFYETEPFLVVQANLDNNESQTVLDDWVVYSFAAIPNTRDLLLVAQPKDDPTAAEKEVGFYRLNVDTLILSEKIHPASILDGTQIQFSSDGKYLLFQWQYSNHPKLQVINYEDWDTVFDMQEPLAMRGLPATLRWLTDEDILIGQVFYTANRTSSFVRVDPISGDIKTLFMTDDRFYFTVIQ
ncbi:MAG: hypothetical protein GC179_27385 [Anaerolineaceae bacterium]|nr:hypothetical protein [Anaerolineaceae bacterium]